MKTELSKLFPGFKAQEVEERGLDGYYHRGSPGESDSGRFVISRAEKDGIEVIAAEDWQGNKTNVVKRVIVVNPR